MNLNDTLIPLYFISKTLALITTMSCFGAFMADAFLFGFLSKKKIHLLLLGGIFLTATAYFSSTSYAPQETCFVDKNGNVAASFPRKTVLWEWDYQRDSHGEQNCSPTPARR